MWTSGERGGREGVGSNRRKGGGKEVIGARGREWSKGGWLENDGKGLKG